MPTVPPGVSLRAVQTALLLGLVTLAVLVLAFGCSGSTPPVRLPPEVACPIGIVEQLPPDPDRVTLGDVKDFVRSYRKCLHSADAGAR